MLMIFIFLSLSSSLDWLTNCRYHQSRDAIKCVKEGMKIPLIIHLTHSIVLALCLSIKQIKQIFILGIISQKKPFCL